MVNIFLFITHVFSFVFTYKDGGNLKITHEDKFIIYKNGVCKGFDINVYFLNFNEDLVLNGDYVLLNCYVINAN